MIDSLLLMLAALGSAYAGMATLALALPAHWGAATHRPQRSAATARVLRWRGAALIFVSLTCAVVRDGWGFGLLLGPLLIAVAGALVIGTLTLRPRLLRVFALGTGTRVVHHQRHMSRG